MTCQMLNSIFSLSPGAVSCAGTQAVFQGRVEQQLHTFASTDPVEGRFIPFPPRAALQTSKEQCTACEEALSGSWMP